MFSLKNLSKMSVLRVLGSKNVIKQVQNHVFCSTCCIFSENPCAKMQKSKKVKKPFVFPEKKNSNTKMNNKKIETLIFKAFLQKAVAIGGRATTMLLHALCVFLCSPLFEPQ